MEKIISGYILGLHWDNGKGNGNYCGILGLNKAIQGYGYMRIRSPYTDIPQILST